MLMFIVTRCVVPFRRSMVFLRIRPHLTVYKFRFVVTFHKTIVNNRYGNVTCSVLNLCNRSKEPILTNYVPKRLKFRKKEEDSSDSEDEAETVEDVGKDFKMLKLKVNSLRADLVLKAALGMARNKVEAAFFQNKVRLNGAKILKKSAQLNVEDELDLVRGTSKLNPEFIMVSRVKLVSYSQKDEKYTATVQCFRSMTIENYPDDPWKQIE